MLDYQNLTNFSKIVSKLSIFLFIIAGNYVGDIYSCGLRHLFNEYIYLKHIIGFFIMLFFVGVAQEDLTIKTKFFQSVILYIWFIFIMRSPMIITIFVIILIILIYLLDLYISDLKKNLENKEDLNGENTDEEINKLIIKYTKISNALFIISFVATFLGFLYFIYILKKTYGNQFNVLSFVLGSRDQECFTHKIYNKFKTDPFLYDLKLYNKKNNNKVLDFIPRKIKKRMMINKE